MPRAFLWLLSLRTAAAPDDGLARGLRAPRRAGLPRPSGDRAGSTPTPARPVPLLAPRAFDRVAQPGRWEALLGTGVADGIHAVPVPGPEIRLREGDRARVHVIDHLPVPTTFPWHGVELAYAADGVPGPTQPPIPPGLHGMPIIEPRAGGSRYDREATLFSSEPSLDVPPAVALAQAPYPIYPGDAHALAALSGGGPGSSATTSTAALVPATRAPTVAPTPRPTATAEPLTLATTVPSGLAASTPTPALTTRTLGATPIVRPAASGGMTPTPAPPPAGGGNTRTIEVGGSFSAQTAVRGPRRTTAVWGPTGRDARTLASLGGLFPALRNHQTFARAFQRPGAYPYLCRQYALTMPE
jgi:hypothetical protein